MTTGQPYTPSMGEARGRYSDGAHHQGAPEPYPGAHLDAWDRFIAQVRRDAARDALDGFAQEVDANGSWWPGTGPHSPRARAALDYRDTHYPEETR